MIPIIGLIGRKNVGKSTIFNMLTKTRNASVSDYEGLTRDIRYGYINVKNEKQFVIIDTAGLDIKKDTIEIKAYQKTLTAIQESHIILFVVSAPDGLIPQDYDIYHILLKYQKKIILLINKIDQDIHLHKTNEFYSFGIKNLHKISAIHNQGINTLILRHLIPWMNSKFYKKRLDNTQLQKINKNHKSIRVAFIGRPNSGKSTLKNAFLNQQRMITDNRPGTTLESISTNMLYNKKSYMLIDTAGVSKKKKEKNNIEYISTIKTLQTITQTDVVLLIIDANETICHQDLALSDIVIKSKKSLVVVLNKSDLLSLKQKENLQVFIKNKLKFLTFSRIHFVSALYRIGLSRLFDSINESYYSLNRTINTAKLTKIMQTAIKNYQPPMHQNRRIKLKYAHLGSLNPIHIVIHGNQVQQLSLSYKKYLINFFCKALNLKGILIQIKFKNNFNPYNKQNNIKK